MLLALVWLSHSTQSTFNTHHILTEARGRGQLYKLTENELLNKNKRKKERKQKRAPQSKQQPAKEEKKKSGEAGSRMAEEKTEKKNE